MQAPSVSVVENHDAAYHQWRSAGVAGRVLVHVDAHHDMAWIGDGDQLTIGNYVCQAIKDGLVREVIWVVPDGAWASRSQRSALRRHLKTLQRTYQVGTATIHGGYHWLSTRLGTVPVTICSFDSLPPLSEAVLLDLDTDFLMLPVVAYFQDDRPGETPWIWPEELVAALRTKEIRSDIVTIAYSVAGGYTPLRWKYLGDELALGWIADSPAAATVRRGFQLVRQAALALEPTAHAESVSALEQAVGCLPASATPPYLLAKLHQRAGDTAEARRWFSRAIALDPAFRGPHSSRGFACLSQDRLDEAATEFEELLSLEPHNEFAWLGIGRLSLIQCQWKEAEAELRRAIELSPQLVDAYAYLGDTLVKLSRDDEASAAYARCLKLDIEGTESIEAPIHTPGFEAALTIGRHGRIHAALASIDARAGRLSTAVAGYRLALATGAYRLGARRKLALLYLRQGQIISAIAECAQAIRLIPRSLAPRIKGALERQANRWLSRA